MVNVSMRALIIAGSLLLPPAVAVPAFADSPAPSTSASPQPSAVAGLQGSIRGRGSVSLSGEDGTLDFGVVARPEAGKHGRHGDLRIKEASGLHYNGAIRTYSVSGTTATIAGGGGLVDENGAKHHVRFSATVTAGGPGAGALDVTFTGKDGYSEHYSGTLASGEIAIKG